MLIHEKGAVIFNEYFAKPFAALSNDNVSAAYPDADLTKACEDLPHVNEAGAKVFERLALTNEEHAIGYAGLTKATEDSSNINVSGVNAIAALAQMFAGLSKNNGSGTR